MHVLASINELLKSNKNIIDDVQKLLDEKAALSKQVEKFAKDAQGIIKQSLKESLNHIFVSMNKQQKDASHGEVLSQQCASKLRETKPANPVESWVNSADILEKNTISTNGNIRYSVTEDIGNYVAVVLDFTKGDAQFHHQIARLLCQNSYFHDLHA